MATGVLCNKTGDQSQKSFDAVEMSNSWAWQRHEHGKQSKGQTVAQSQSKLTHINSEIVKNMRRNRHIRLGSYWAPLYKNKFSHNQDSHASWKVMEFKIENFQAWKVWTWVRESHGKSWNLKQGHGKIVTIQVIFNMVSLTKLTTIIIIIHFCTVQNCIIKFNGQEWLI